MKNTAPALISRKDLDRYQAALVAWLIWALFLVMRLGENAHRSKRVHRAISRCERFVHAFLICTVFSRMHAGKERPRNIAPGIRAHKSHPRLLARNFRLRHGTFLARILHVLNIFTKPARFLARLARKLRNGPRVNLVLATACVETLASLTPREIAGPDSS